MRVKIKRFDKSLPLPDYASSGAAAVDLYARQAVVIRPQQVKSVPLNIALQLPPNHWALLAARSSLYKKGLMMVNGIGVGDFDYRGDGDEYHAVLFNFSDQPAQIKKGERIVQVIILSRDRIEFEELDEFANPDRGGFGSTGR